MSIHKRYLRKFGYSITKNRIIELLDGYALDSKEKTKQVRVPRSDWSDFEFVVRVDSDFVIASSSENDDVVDAELIRKEDGLNFTVIKEITPETHPWIAETIPKGSELEYTDKPHYGTINRYDGLALDVDGTPTQVNYDFITVKK
ncbi:hypothetical protein [Gracilimonas mengyeensis]|uniref:Uncharacterized protein n=1 Tax=Gracilimonas mengyeensis TaxID=1302730 RepID=A0A521BMN3_9BACT|nr:hypothetical protein [Gracilimonas mengyeensis]SMO48359.1 hypothetical protein SAMN06265219_102399 [Gracilimonas mengyeensis]